MLKRHKKPASLEKKYFLMWPHFLRRFVGILAIVLIVAFLGFSVERIFSAPSLVIFEPMDDLITKSQRLDIIGRSEPEAEVIINNRNIAIDAGGNFKTSVDLQNGLNLIKITAKKRYGRVREVDLRVLLK